MAYRVIVTNQMGFAYAELEHATPGSPTWEINEPGTFEFTMPADDPKVPYCRMGREIQLWDGNTLVWWGPIVRPKVDSKTASYQCEGLLWYFQRRMFGRADRINYLTNGGFEDATLAPWTAVQAAGTLTATIGTADPLEGSQVLLLSSSGLAQPQNYVKQIYTHNQVHPNGDLMTLSAWARVPAATYVGPAFDQYGLWAEHRNTAGDRVAWGFDPLTDSEDGEPYKYDTWTRSELAFPGMQDGDELEVRLYAPNGAVRYDMVRLVYMESLAWIDADQATILAGIISYAQDRPSSTFVSFNHGKSDLFIETDCPATGVKYSRDWQFADHDQIGDALREFTESDNGVDIAVTYAQVGNSFVRTFRTYFPSQGSYKPELALERGRNIIDFSWAFDGTEAASNVVILGSGEGPDREEGLASDPTALSGVTFEKVSAAPDGTDVAILDSLAADDLRISANPEMLEVDVASGWAGGLGDTVPVRIVWGSFVVDGVYRVVRIRLNPGPDTLSVTLNREPSTVEEAMARFPHAVDACIAPGGGVWVVGSDGGVGAYGGAAYHGSMGGQPISAPMVAIVAHSAGGYWLASADGGIFAFGSAPVRYPYLPMIVSEYANGDRAIVAAELESVDNLILIADDGATYVGLLTP